MRERALVIGVAFAVVGALALVRAEWRSPEIRSAARSEAHESAFFDAPIVTTPAPTPAGAPPVPTDTPVPGPAAATQAPLSKASAATPNRPPDLGPSGARSDEPALMARLRAIGTGDPAAAIDLAREGNRLFPESDDAPERSSILIHALVAQGRSMEARGEAEDVVNRYPDSSWVREMELFTGAHRHRNIRLNDAGALEYF